MVSWKSEPIPPGGCSSVSFFVVFSGLCFFAARKLRRQIRHELFNRPSDNYLLTYSNLGPPRKTPSSLAERLAFGRPARADRIHKGAALAYRTNVGWISVGPGVVNRHCSQLEREVVWYSH